MSVIALASSKGSPGVTTTACLLGAVWPARGRPVVCECDPHGGDLAARFTLSTRQGWTSLVAAARRQGRCERLDDHLQELPGGLPVLVGARDPAMSRPDHLVSRWQEGPGPSDGPWDLLVDLGRLDAGHDMQASWLAVADQALLVTRTDAASVVHVMHDAVRWGSRLRDRVAVVTVGPNLHPDHEVERAIGLRLAAHLPFDPAVASRLCGQQAPTGNRTLVGLSGARRLRRSELVQQAVSLAARLADEVAPTTDGVDLERQDPADEVELAQRRGRRDLFGLGAMERGLDIARRAHRRIRAGLHEAAGPGEAVPAARPAGEAPTPELFGAHRSPAHVEKVGSDAQGRRS